MSGVLLLFPLVGVVILRAGLLIVSRCLDAIVF